ncbi:hypothetical protein JCM8097_002240 [Rhodosporidiobolus ruineniae]
MPRTTQRASALKAKLALAEVEDKEDGEDYVSPDEGGDGDEDDEEEFLAEAMPAPPPKKARTSRGRPLPKIKGRLKGFLNLPVELVTKVCSHLDFPTLFHLSRLNKRFYRVLRDPTLEYIWQWARQESGFPALEATDMSIYKYANLLFGLCKGCGRTTTKVDYYLRLRTCKACTPYFIRNSTEDDWPYYEEASEYVMFSNYQGLRHRKYSEYTIEDLRIVRTLLSGGTAAYAGYTSVGFYEKDLFRAACEKLRKTRTADGNAILDYYSEREREKERELEALRDRRYQTFDYPNVREHELVRLGKCFTEEDWDNMVEPLEAVLRGVKLLHDQRCMNDEVNRRRAVLEQQHSDLYQDKNAAKACGLYPLVPWTEFVALSTVKQLFEVDSTDVQRIDPSLQASSPAISAELDERRVQLRRAIFDRLRSTLATATSTAARAASSTTSSSSTLATALSSPPIPAPLIGPVYSPEEVDRFLRRAVSLVQCGTCQMIDTLSRLFTHQCASSSSYSYFANSRLWSTTYDVSAQISSAAVKTVEAAGRSSDTLASEMDDLGPAFSCSASNCTAATIGVSWRQASRGYSYSTYSYSSGCEVSALVFENREDVKARLYRGSRALSSPVVIVARLEKRDLPGRHG